MRTSTAPQSPEGAGEGDETEVLGRASDKGTDAVAKMLRRALVEGTERRGEGGVAGSSNGGRRKIPRSRAKREDLRSLLAPVAACARLTADDGGAAHLTPALSLSLSPALTLPGGRGGGEEVTV